MCLEIWTIGPSEALIVCGPGYGRQNCRVIRGPSQSVFTLSCWNKVIKVSTSVVGVSLHSLWNLTSIGVPINISSKVILKIVDVFKVAELYGESLNYLDDNDSNSWSEIAKIVLDGYQKAVIGQMTPQQIRRNEDNIFINKVLELSHNDLNNLGIKVVSMFIKDVWDDVGYFIALNNMTTANILKDFRIKVAEAKMDKSIEVAQLNSQLEIARLDCDSEKIKSKSVYLLAHYKSMKDVEKIRANMNHDTEYFDVRLKRDIKIQYLNSQLIEKKKQVELADLDLKCSIIEKNSKKLKFDLDKELSIIRAKTDFRKKKLEVEAESEAKVIAVETQAYLRTCKYQIEVDRLIHTAKKIMNGDLIDVKNLVMTKIKEELKRKLSPRNIPLVDIIKISESIPKCISTFIGKDYDELMKKPKPLPEIENEEGAYKNKNSNYHNYKDSQLVLVH